MCWVDLWDLDAELWGAGQMDPFGRVSAKPSQMSSLGPVGLDLSMLSESNQPPEDMPEYIPGEGSSREPFCPPRKIEDWSTPGHLAQAPGTGTGFRIRQCGSACWRVKIDRHGT